MRHVCLRPLLALALFVSPPAQRETSAVVAEPRAIAAQDPRHERAPSAGGAAAFERIKGLTGEWHAPEGQDVMINIFRPIAFGSAMLHEEWKRGEQLTATIFYMVGDELRADHFCDYRNQLRYVVTPSSDPDALQFTLREGLNLDVQPRHFHSTTWRFLDATRLTQDWHIEGGGKNPAKVRLEFRRQK
jgi:hypothetical protein